MDVERRWRKNKQSKKPIPLFVSEDGTHVSDRVLRQIFTKNKQYPEKQLWMAQGSIQRYGVDPSMVLGFIDDEVTRVSLQNWCEVEGYKIKEEANEDPDVRARRVLERDRELIDSLGSFVPQHYQARILQAIRYREADAKTAESLVSGYYRLLGDYLGPRRAYQREVPSIRGISIPDLPPELFEDELISTILWQAEREAILPLYIKDPVECFQYLGNLVAITDNPAKRVFTEDMVQYFQNVDKFVVPGFVQLIPGSQKDMPIDQRKVLHPFPARQQREFAYRLVHKEIGPFELMAWDTRTQKTGAVIYGFEAAKTECSVVVTTPGTRDNWQREIEEKYQDKVKVVKIEKFEDFYKLIDYTPDKRPRWIILGYSLLSSLDQNKGKDILKQFVKKFGVDSLAVDETHLANNPDANCTEMIYTLSKQLDESAPRVVMTATGLVNQVEDLDAPVRFLMPFRYDEPGSFTRASRNQPELVSALLHGQQLLSRLTKEAVFGEKLPKMEEEDIPVALNYFHEAIYNFVLNDSTIEAQNKRGILRQALLDPMLIRRHYNPGRIQAMMADLNTRKLGLKDERMQEVIQLRIKALEERLALVQSLSNQAAAKDSLALAFERYQEFSTHHKDEKFNEEFLVKIGLENTALWSFFNSAKGLNDLAAQANNPALQSAWQSEEMVSSFYQSLFKRLEQLVKIGDKKVAIFSGFFQSGVTSGFEDKSLDDDLAFDSLYDHLRARFGQDVFLKIDGTVSLEVKKGELAERERVRRAFRLDPSTWLLGTIRASRLGIDLSVPKTDANANLTGVEVFVLDPPDTSADYTQLKGRFLSVDQEIPIKVNRLRSTPREYQGKLRYGFIDHGIWQAVWFKRLLSQMVLDGIPFTKDEEAFVRQNLSHVRIQSDSTITPRRYLNEIFYSLVRGRGFESNRTFLSQDSGFEGLTYREFFATAYADEDEHYLAGHNARAVSQIIKQFCLQNDSPVKNRIASIGAGTGILQHILRQPVFNLDMLPEILQIAINLQEVDGQFVVGNGAKIPFADKSFRVSDASLMLHWSKNIPDRLAPGVYVSERAIILQELNRITEDGGLVTFSLPHSALTPASFRLWRETLEGYFGFKMLDEMPSGLLKATDFRVEPISWVFNLQKIGSPRLGFENSSLNLDFEPLTTIIDSKSAQARDSVIMARRPLPHFMFEITQPETGVSKAFEYTPVELDRAKVEESLIGKYRIFRSHNQVLAELGSMEWGFYFQLRNHARSIWDLAPREADKIALEALTSWANGNYSKDNANKIWTDLKEITEKIMRNY